MHFRAIDYCLSQWPVPRIVQPEKPSHQPIYMVLTQNVAKMLLSLEEGEPT